MKNPFELQNFKNIYNRLLMSLNLKENGLLESTWDTWIMFMIEYLDLECLLKLLIFKTLELGCYQNQEIKRKIM
jgi:hypothetical protein